MNEEGHVVFPDLPRGGWIAMPTSDFDVREGPADPEVERLVERLLDEHRRTVLAGNRRRAGEIEAQLREVFRKERRSHRARRLTDADAS